MYKDTERLSTVTLIAGAIVAVALLIAGTAYAVTGPKLSVAVGTFANETVALTLETVRGCEAGEYVAPKIVRDQPTLAGGWTQPTPEDVRVRWLATPGDDGPDFSDNGHYWMSKFEIKHIEIRHNSTA